MPRSFYDFILSCFYQTGAPSFLQLAFSPFLSLSFACLSVIFRPSLASLCVPVLLYGWHVDISISLLAVVVGFCGLALLVVSLFVFWKLCWPIWRSKALPTHVENGLHVGFPDMPPTASPPVTECKVAEVEKKYPLEMKVNGRSTVKLLEAAMKISQTSPDIPAEVQTALREKLSQQAKIQRQTTEPTSSSRYPTWTRCSHTPPPLRRQNRGEKLPPPPTHMLTMRAQWQHFWTHRHTNQSLQVLIVRDRGATALEVVWHVSGTGWWPWNAVAHVALCLSWPEKSPPAPPNLL